MTSRTTLMARMTGPSNLLLCAFVEARQKRERDKFLAIVCTNNPYEAVWHPAERTCERFAAASAN